MMEKEIASRKAEIALSSLSVVLGRGGGGAALTPSRYRGRHDSHFSLLHFHILRTQFQDYRQYYRSREHILNIYLNTMFERDLSSSQRL